MSVTIALNCRIVRLLKKWPDSKEERGMFNPKWEEIFPSRHKNDDRYRKHCVDCGKLLYRYELCWDGHRNERGEIVEKYDWVKTLGGLRCPECNTIFETILLKAYINSKDKEDGYYRCGCGELIPNGVFCIDCDLVKDLSDVEN